LAELKKKTLNEEQFREDAIKQHEEAIVRHQKALEEIKHHK
jgi:hypothetical protein